MPETPCITRIGGSIAKWSALAALLVLVSGILYGLSNPSLKMIEQDKYLKRIIELNDAWQMITIYMNNLSVMLALYVLSIAIIPGLKIIFDNGYIIGSVATIGSRSVGKITILMLLLPHGVFELYAFIYTAALAISLPIALIKQKRNQKEILINQLYGLLYTSIILFVAAFIEAFVTARIASLVTG